MGTFSCLRSRLQKNKRYFNNFGDSFAVNKGIIAIYIVYKTNNFLLIQKSGEQN
jgi:hypothetical protein